MQRYGRIFAGFWTSSDIAGLSAETKLIAAYLLTCHHANMLGCFRLPIAYVVEDLKMSSATVAEGFRNLFSNGFLTYDSDLSWILIAKFLKWNPIENPNQGIAASKFADGVPRNSSVHAPLVQILKENPRNFPDGFLDRLETVAEPYRNPHPHPHPHPQPQPQPIPEPQIKDPADSSHEQPAGGVITLPLKDGTSYQVPQILYEEYRKAYEPAVNVMEQLGAMRVWLLSNPGKRKTREGITRFINGWLKGDRDNPGGSPRKRSPRAESFGTTDYAKGFGLAPGENVGRL